MVISRKLLRNVKSLPQLHGLAKASTYEGRALVYAMVNIYVFKTAQKFQFLSHFLFQTTRRILKNVLRADSTMGFAAATRSMKANIAYRTSERSLKHPKPPKSPEKPVRDPEYYKDESQGGFCVFQVENKLFKVHRFFLMREPSALEDMLRYPQKRYNNHGTSDDNPVVLPDRVDQFRDLLWALYALPSDLQRLSDPRMTPPFERLLNIAEMSSKYCIASYMSWSVEHIYALTRDANGPLRNAPADICARVLKIAITSNNAKFLEVVIKKLMTRILWHNLAFEPILPIAEAYGLRQLRGICYYRQLIKMERDTPYFRQSGVSQLAVPLTFSMEKRIGFFHAHHSLIDLWERLCSNPPIFDQVGCPSHGLCLDTWTHLWHEAASSPQILRYGPADVLGRLKILMIQLRDAMNEMPSINMQCTLTALETISTIRDKIIADLARYFEPS
ncbi:hypothetical protein APHAL10511_002773 [Amanita phalloides]|nr:hypothetical protein APHAL10511_002773 [Amanita phalloides]